MKVVGLIAGATTTALAGGVLWMSPAQAQHFARSDPAGDMVTNSHGGVVVHPNHHNLDIRRVTVRYRPHHLNIRMKFYNLRWPRHDDLVLNGFIYTNRRAMPYQDYRDGPWQWEVDFSPGHPYKPSMITIYDALEPGNVYTCFAGFGFGNNQQGMTAPINYRKKFLIVSYPRRCLAPDSGSPPALWVRVSADSYGGHYYDHWVAPNHTTYPDWSRAFYTPRLYPG